MAVRIPGSNGIVGFCNKELICFSCPPGCQHLDFVKRTKDKEDIHKWPAIADLMSYQSPKERLDHMSRCISKAKIPFVGNRDYMEKVNSASPESYMPKDVDGETIFFMPVCSCGAVLDNEYQKKEEVLVVSEHRLQYGSG